MGPVALATLKALSYGAHGSPGDGGTAVKLPQALYSNLHPFTKYYLTQEHSDIFRYIIIN